jgi:excisionase family DNA binding protein
MVESKMIHNGFWDIEDLSCYLKVKVKTLYAMVRDIPHYRVGKLIRFKKEEIEAWMENKRANVQDVKTRPRKKRKPMEVGHHHIDRLIRNTIDQTKQEGYNPDHGKPDRIKGLMGKEVDHGLI